MSKPRGDVKSNDADPTGQDIGVYHPADHEWALIINTNGDTYSNGDTYWPTGYMGNAFHQTLDEIFAGPQYARATTTRMQRARVCKACPYYRHCDQPSLIEAIDSERAYDAQGNLVCSIARPMIEFIVEGNHALLGGEKPVAVPCRPATEAHFRQRPEMGAYTSFAMSGDWPPTEEARGDCA